MRLDPTETWNMARNGARLVLRYDAANQRVRGTLTNRTGATIPRARVEFHLAGAAELEPKTPPAIPSRSGMPTRSAAA